MAIGATGVAEDITPAYLPAEPVPFCARKGCKVPGTEVALHDGRTGYLSEIYVEPCHRKGMGLAECISG